MLFSLKLWIKTYEVFFFSYISGYRRFGSYNELHEGYITYLKLSVSELEKCFPFGAT